jgi:hypothetical protein
MKLSDITKGRPVICRFDDIDDHHGGTIVKEPQYQENPYDSAKEMLVIILENEALTLELRARSQMIDAITDAVLAAGEKSVAVGGYLDVTFIGYRGQLKLYKAVYEPPGADRRSDTGPLASIGVATLESDPDNSDEESDDDAPPW